MIGTPARARRDTGAAAVELALVLPVLLLLVFGIIDFGRMLHAQLVLTEAAREGARAEAVGSNYATRVQKASSGLGAVTAVPVETCPDGATPPTGDAVIQANHSFEFITPVGSFATLFGGDVGGAVQLSGKGVMPCMA